MIFDDNFYLVPHAYLKNIYLKIRVTSFKLYDSVLDLTCSLIKV